VRGGLVTAVLGPTNTGKTHRAITAMLDYPTGMIGVPLRLLAREVYDRVVAARGPDAVALVTGEEKRIPAAPKYFVCTTEAMPVDRSVHFVAVDEVQLAADRHRGHVFTERLLHARGEVETMLLGSDSMAPLLQRALPGIRVERRQRLSTLSWVEEHKLTATPKRAAIVCFSVEQVYEVAERIRHAHGGAAVVLGALSPRTRNAQVALYQAGDVQHLVATDAIGMGLNLDVAHVAFQGKRKFDGTRSRELTAPEVAQIAGRAGRFTADGTFSATRECGPFDADLLAAVTSHQFPPVTAIFWRNPELDLRSIPALRQSLAAPPPARWLVPAHDEEDERALAALAADPALVARAKGTDAVGRVWEVCGIPDFRKTLTDAHARMLAEIVAFRLTGEGTIPTDWFAERVRRLDRTEGDLDTLMARIAWIRTWTYVAHQRRWLREADHWRGETRAIEDRLSDALHERLTARFVDRRAIAVVGGARAEVTGDGVWVAGERVGRWTGLSWQPAMGATVLRGVVERSLGGAAEARAEALAAADDAAFRVEDDGRVWADDLLLGRLLAGPSLGEPSVAFATMDLIPPAVAERLRTRVRAWTRRWAHGPAFDDFGLSPEARAVLRAVTRGLGVASLDALAPLARSDRSALHRRGVVVGARYGWRADAFAPEPARVRAVAAAVWRGQVGVPLPRTGPPSWFSLAASTSQGWAPNDYAPLGPLAVRVDRAEALVADPAAAGPGGPTAVARALGCPVPEAAAVLRALRG
jgi:ATP-dependent RNA helicase SUPV3L1/SUV3